VLCKHNHSDCCQRRCPVLPMLRHQWGFHYLIFRSHPSDVQREKQQVSHGLKDKRAVLDHEGTVCPMQNGTGVSKQVTADHEQVLVLWSVW
jgi:hypothetical protein